MKIIFKNITEQPINTHRASKHKKPVEVNEKQGIIEMFHYFFPKTTQQGRVVELVLLTL